MIFSPIEKKEKLYVKIAEQINNAIQNKKFKAGDRLPAEREISSQLGVSRTSVREALAVLEMMDIIEIKIGDGSYIKKYAPDFQFEIKKIKNNSAFELIEVRIHIESIITKLAIERASEKDILEIEYTNQHLKTIIHDDEKIDEFFTYGVMFHKKLAKATHNDILIQIVNSLFEQNDHPLWQHLNKKAIKSYEARSHQLKEHEAIVTSIKNKDYKVAEELMTHHLEHLTAMLYD
ncbi:FadR family transcriptional regulator [Peribacillus cavernae]|uniref:FadR family transcriptional regulator n=1 Tax=Peribacillus cavernae TaxID=1674310 RepID=A0A3S0UAG6_9BACI|nr:FadR/GntR family transcriptional regulator [Peribacillus cavernae]MDQ0221190.1 DNA-binding FadR family transcriptional regulator [Peribacillus cavernae]RUQ26931.1 FadR family transcriptional regulator [Peribacillus cavernae]